jgi:hypothetical protein
VAWLLERTADDENASNGCSECPVGRDAFTGWGRLDVAAALTRATDGTPLPQPDAYEPNDNAGTWAHALPPLPHTISATLDYWDDDVDVYRVALHAGQRLFARLTQESAGRVGLVLWRPGTVDVSGEHAKPADRIATGTRVAGQLRLGFRAKVAGTYYIEARLNAGTQLPLAYRLAVARSAA